MADTKVFQLVTDLCASFPTPKEEVQEDYLCYQMVKESETDPSICFDKVLAKLFDMGYKIEVASRAILECGRLDVTAAIEHMNSEARAPVAIDPPVMPSTYEAKVQSVDKKVNLEQEEQHVPNFVTGPKYRRTAPCEAGTSKTHVEDEDGWDSDRWEHDEPDADKESCLLRIFPAEDVTAAIAACGIDSDVNDLANHIINYIVDPPENSWDDDDDDPVDEDMVDAKYVKKAYFEDLASTELPDQGQLVLKKLGSMGLQFTAKRVAEAIQACGKDADEDALVDYLLKTDECAVGGENSRDAMLGGENSRDAMLGGENSRDAMQLTKLQQMKQLGCTSTAACLRAIDNNAGADILELLDYYWAEEFQDRGADEDGYNRDSKTPPKQRKRKEIANSTKFVQKKAKKGDFDEDEEDEEEVYSLRFHRNMKGFGLPGEPVIPRVLNEDISRPPYFYFENVALTPKDEWNNIQRHLYNIAPEFVDSLNFAPCRRPRGYIHNLPVEGRVNILPKPPMTVQELIPGSAEFWPAWDTRVKLNTINTRAASEFVRRQIQSNIIAVENGVPSCKDIKSIMYWAKRWNLVWIRPGVLAPLSPVDIERCLGFDADHTRVLYSPTDRVRVLGNSFQVNTVAYHLSVLRPMYKNGIRVLSLFSGIGGAEVALHKLGIFLKIVVSVEIDDKARMVVDSWWKTTNQKGRLIHSLTDVREVDSRRIQSLVDEFGGFDLVIGGSPCNNLSGNNRCTRTGLAGPASVTFFEFPRILAEVRDYMRKKGRA